MAKISLDGRFLNSTIELSVTGFATDRIETHLIKKTDLLRSIFRVKLEIKVKARITETISLPLNKMALRQKSIKIKYEKKARITI
jgi:hypothetical protein